MEKLMWSIFLILSTAIVSADDENVMLTSNVTSDADQEQGENEEMIFSAPAPENTPEPVGMPKSSKQKSHHHSKQRDHLENVQSHRKPVYEAVSQPCYSYSCRGYGQVDGFQPWQSRGNRVVPYPQPFYETRQRGPYSSQDYYFDEYYGSREPGFGYRPRGPGYNQGRFGSYGGYGQPNYGRRFLG
ncbi:uncharacterized protein TNCT_153041 [Trichonephila clavata]|uniref:Uncharacterized protein n=1 Tax=Trichonephila clavata TaxID=2740835 RepID=A0A8X6M2U5_TRICU|nr:uncharacterized protein TNCT_153041 [Trichonephila clavata]